MEEEYPEHHSYDLSLNQLREKFPPEHPLISEILLDKKTYSDALIKVIWGYLVIFWVIQMGLILVLFNFFFSANLIMQIMLVVFGLFTVILNVLLGIQFSPSKNKKLTISNYGLQITHKARKVQYSFRWSEIKGIYKMGLAQKEKSRKKRRSQGSIRT